MAEARTIGSTGDLYRVLLDSNLYARVEQVSSNVNCYDAAAHLVLKTTGYTDIAAYIDASHSFPATSLGTINQAFLCERGVLLTKYYSGTLRHVYVLSRTNIGEPAFVDLDVTGDDWTALTWAISPRSRKKTCRRRLPISTRCCPLSRTPQSVSIRICRMLFMLPYRPAISFRAAFSCTEHAGLQSGTLCFGTVLHKAS